MSRNVDPSMSVALSGSFDTEQLPRIAPEPVTVTVARTIRPGFEAQYLQWADDVVSTLRTVHGCLGAGVLLPGPDIGRKASAEMRAIAEAGFETGIHTWDHVLWQDNVRERDAAWTARQMGASYKRFAEIFGHAPVTHGAAGWQMNDHAFRQIDTWGMAYASDGRGTHPYIPSVDGQALNHVQLPTTLPTLDELVGVDGLDIDGAIDRILDLTATPNAAGLHVYTLHAELEGQRFLDPFLRLVDTWRARGLRVGTMAEAAAALDPRSLPRHEVLLGEIAGRSGTLGLQGNAIS